MVVAYRLGAITAFLLRRLGLVKVPYFSQPNLLLGRRRVPEFFQEAVTPAALGEALLGQLADPARRSAELQKEFLGVHEVLRRGGADQSWRDRDSGLRERQDARRMSAKVPKRDPWVERTLGE